MAGHEKLSFFFNTFHDSVKKNNNVYLSWNFSITVSCQDFVYVKFENKIFAYGLSCLDVLPLPPN